ncbi:MAG: acyl carrier protein [Acidobacteriota bacterium]
MNSLMFDRVRDILADIFNLSPDQISTSSSPDNIEGWDSLQHLNVVLALEKEFDLQFSPEEIEQMLSVELIVDLLEEKLAAIPTI